MKNIALLLLLVSSYSFGLSTDLSRYIPEQIQGDQLVNKRYFLISYSNIHEQPEWAFYKLNKQMISGKTKRMHYFRKDTQVIDETPSMTDYKNSGFDRGHLVPAADMKLNRDSMRSTFVMSNVVPQRPGFNRKTWKILETKVRDFVKKKESIFVITGPVLEGGLKKFSEQKISVPDRFYKILFRIVATRVEAISFLVPHNASSTDLREFVTSIDEIESVTGNDFLKGLPDHIEEELESEYVTGSWEL